jgi:hypothetical protein
VFSSRMTASEEVGANRRGSVRGLRLRRAAVAAGDVANEGSGPRLSRWNVAVDRAGSGSAIHGSSSGSRPRASMGSGSCMGGGHSGCAGTPADAFCR